MPTKKPAKTPTKRSKSKREELIASGALTPENVSPDRCETCHEFPTLVEGELSCLCTEATTPEAKGKLVARIITGNTPKPRAEYTDDIGDAICEEIATGRSLYTVCIDKGLHYTTVLRWLQKHEDFGANYARARESRADLIADQILDIADDVTVPSDVARVRIDARKWYAGKLKPKAYGDAVTLKGDKESPLAAITVTTQVLDVLSLEQLEQIREKTIEHDAMGS
ncbi:MAG: hypothetical protein WC100_01430 [Sterolibacterium sp.]